MKPRKLSTLSAPKNIALAEFSNAVREVIGLVPLYRIDEDQARKAERSIAAALAGEPQATP
jgi:hypothetical protein